jgi:hypothetical protein
VSDVAEVREVLVMKPKPACELPDTFNRVEVGAICREKGELESLGLLPPLEMQAGVVVPHIVKNHHSPPTGADTASSQRPEEVPTASRIEGIRLLAMDELAVPKANSTEISNALPSGWS